MEKNENKTSGLKEFFAFIRKYFGAIVISLVMLTSLVCSVTALSLVSSLGYRLDTYVKVSETSNINVATELCSIRDDIDFLRNWCASAPTVTLGDTYINQTEKNSSSTYTDSSKSLVNKSGSTDKKK